MARYFVESLTNEMERRCYEYFRKIDELGGMVDAVKHGFPQREIAEAAFELQMDIDAGRRVVVGVNQYLEGDDRETPLLRIDPECERRQVGVARVSQGRRETATWSRRGWPRSSRPPPPHRT